MWRLPPIPEWDAVHPLIIHFPIALLIVAPLFVLAAIIVRSWRKPFAVAAFILMLLGTIGTFVAVATGGAAAQLVIRNEAIDVVLAVHQNLAEKTRMLFSVLTVIYALLFLLLLSKRKRMALTWVVASFIFLGVHCSGLLLLVNAAHNGGRLVHEFGVHAMIPPEPLPNAVPPDDD